MDTLKNIVLVSFAIEKFVGKSRRDAISSLVFFYQEKLKKVFLPRSGHYDYADFGKKARDLLYADYKRGFIVDVCDDQVTCSLTKLRRRRPMLGRLSIETSLNKLNTVLDIDTSGAVFITSSIEAIAPKFTQGLSCVVSVNQDSCKTDLHYFRGLVSLSTRIGLFNNPIFSVSGVLGNDIWAFGTDLSMNTNTLEVTRINAGFSSTWGGKTVSLSLEEKGKLLKGQYYHPLSKYTIGGEWCFNLARRSSSLAFGAQHHDIDVKARVDHEGVAALFRHKLSPESFVSFSVEKRFNKKKLLFGVAIVFGS